MNSQWLFLNLLALNYLFAFWSLFIQVKGLYCAKGITPIRDVMATFREQTRSIRFWELPTLFLWNDSDGFIRACAGAGLVLPLLIFAGFPPAPLLAVLWLLYLAFFIAGSDFLSFQWDTLLLEVGFVGIVYAIQAPPPLMLTLVLWFLAFRLLFSSGIVKILSQCPAWKSCTAMDFHYETQPLPNRVAYYMHYFHRPFSKLSTWGVFFLEIMVPFLFFLPAELRLIGVVLSVILQILIMVTGNYAFFNTLTIALLVPLIDERYLTWMGEQRIEALPYNLFTEIGLTFVGAFLFLLNVLMLWRTLKRQDLLIRLQRLIAPFALTSTYGLFARMTTERIEIVVEGSMDGQEWKVYEFKWKPGDLKQPPRQVAPYQPRLDWQMWFLPFSNYKYNEWFIHFMLRLLEGSKEVLHLLKTNPFPEQPPKYVRAVAYQYHFTEPEIQAKTGEWWQRTYKGVYAPPMTLKK
jgi:hypothetical protein